MSPTTHQSQSLAQVIKASLSPLAWAAMVLCFVAVFAFSTYFLLFSALLSLPFLAGVSALGALATIPIFPSRLWRVRLGTAFVGLSLLVLFFDVPARELDERIDHLAHVARTQSPDSWMAWERDGLLMLSATMARGGMLMGYFEVAREHEGMHHEGPQVRDFRGLFPVDSPTIRAFVCNSAASEQPLFFANEGPRYALAFNGGHIKKTVNKLATEVELTIAIRYRKTSTSPLFVARGLAGGHHLFVIDEGVFWGLSETNHLHKYQARWRWRVPHSVCSAQKAAA